MSKFLLVSAFALLLAGCGAVTRIDLHNLNGGGPGGVRDSSVVLALDAARAHQSPGCASLTWADASAGGHNGVLQNFSCAGGSGWTGDGSASSPFALSFDAVGQVLTQLSVSPASLPNATWEVWFKPKRLTYAANQNLLSDGSGEQTRSLFIEGGNAHVEVSTAAGSWTGFDADDGAWQYVAVVFTPSDIVAYKNGRSYDSGAAPAVGSSPSPLAVGADPQYGDQFEGEIAKVMVYNRALSAQEVTSHCQQSATLFNGFACD